MQNKDNRSNSSRNCHLAGDDDLHDDHGDHDAHGRVAERKQLGGLVVADNTLLDHGGGQTDEVGETRARQSAGTLLEAVGARNMT